MQWTPIINKFKPREDWLANTVLDPLVNCTVFWTGINCNKCPFLDCIGVYKRCVYYKENLNDDYGKTKPDFCKLLAVSVEEEK